MIHNLWIIKYDQFVGYQLSIEIFNLKKETELKRISETISTMW